MNLKDFFRKTNKRKYKNDSSLRPEVPEGLFVKCNKCGNMVSSSELNKNINICPKCNGYNPLTCNQRISLILDQDSFMNWDFNINHKNPLKVKGYEEKIINNQKTTGLKDSVISGEGKINGSDVAIAVCDSRFMMASMGSYVGEHITKTVIKATEKKLPLIIVTASGGARMQEGIVSLMQMAKTSAAIKRHRDSGLLYIVLLTDPTTGGVTASFAMLGDIILAEPGALVGFAGPRVIEQTIGQSLPEGFQRSEFLLEKGFVDKIVKREDLKNTLSTIIKLHREKNVSIRKENGMSVFCQKLFVKKPSKKKENTPWEIVNISRDNKRPNGDEYINAIFDDFIEFHGDRCGGDDGAIMGGIGMFKGVPVTVIAQVKGKNTEENIKRNFGMPSPSGYRKALRLMKDAEKFGRPIINFIDTPGAYCGITAEEQGQGQAIANNLYEMSDITVPILAIVIGEAGSGGALALAVANQVYMLENSIYSILSPEGYASILWKDGKRAKEAANEMKLTARDLLELGIIEEIINEPDDYTRDKLKVVTRELDKKISDFIMKYMKLDRKEIANNRYNRFLGM
ncbi:MAG: acetyl-CoA carboxylase carboxyltransferase subunit alpha [Anaerovoracaceae bacterium]